MLFQDKQGSSKGNFGMISKTRKNSLKMVPLDASTNDRSNEVSLVSLRQNLKKERMLKVDSNTSLTIRQMPSEAIRSPGFPASPSATKLGDSGFKPMIKD